MTEVINEKRNSVKIEWNENCLGDGDLQKSRHIILRKQKGTDGVNSIPS